MKRREVIAALGGVVVWPALAAAQAGRMAKVGVLVLGNPDPAPFLKTFRAEMEKRGYVEGRTIAYDIRSAERDAKRLPELAQLLVKDEVDVIVGYLTPTAMAAKQATSTIPIVMGSVGDPVASGLVENLSRPTGNVTGVSTAAAELAGKNLEIVREVLPQARLAAVLANSVDPFSKPFVAQAQISAAKAGFELKLFSTPPDADTESIVKQMAADHADVVLLQGSLLRPRTNELLAAHRLPMISPNPVAARQGGLLSYAAPLDETFRQVAFYVDQILKGKKPSELPVQQPARFELVINLKTAKTLGITVPPALLSRADEVIE
jgi:putative ABC transport system substrate-binding protein